MSQIWMNSKNVVNNLFFFFKKRLGTLCAMAATWTTYKTESFHCLSILPYSVSLSLYFLVALPPRFSFTNRGRERQIEERIFTHVRTSKLVEIKLKLNFTLFR